MVITSPKNPLLQELRRAAHAGKPTADGQIVIEGPHLLAEALRSAWSIVQVLATANALERWGHQVPRNIPFLEVSEGALASVSSTETTQGVIALATPASFELGALLMARPLLLILDAIQDPGNAGTLVRSAEAFGAAGVIACQGCVRRANGKFLRATAGSIFRIPFIESVSVEEVVSHLDAPGFKLYALDARAPLPVDQADLRGACALVVGNEGNGVSPGFRTRTIPLGIPVSKVESLNAAVAGSIALFESARQRGTA